MKATSKILLTILLVTAFFSDSAYSENKKRAQAGIRFLSVSTEARASALSGAVTSLDGNSSSMFYNPSSMANMSNEIHVSLGQVKWIADINYVFGSVAYKPMDGLLGTFGFTFTSVDYGDLQSTILASNEQGFLDVGTFNPTAYTVGFGYAKSLTNKFYIGANVKYVKQNLVGGIVDFGSDEAANAQNYNIDVWAFDFGILYKTGLKSLNFGMNIKNFSPEVTYIKESFQLPLLFEMGVSFNAIDLIDVDPNKHSLLISVDALHPRDYDEQLDIGLEYVFQNMVALRVGYTTPTDEQGVSFGGGLQKSLAGVGLGIDYAYTAFGVFSDVHRFSFQFSF